MAEKFTRRIKLSFHSVDPSSQPGIQNGGSLYQNGGLATSARGDSLMNTLVTH